MKLTEAQNKRLRQHAKHHSQNHIVYMRARMRAGDSFATAHKNALNKGYK